MSHNARYAEQDAPNLLTAEDLRRNAMQRFQSDLLNRTQVIKKVVKKDLFNSVFSD